MTAAKDPIGAWSERPFAPGRNLTLDTFRWGRRRLHVPVLVEADVTVAREGMRRHREATGESVSFTAWIIRCVARAAEEHPEVHSLRRGWRRVVLFEDVDVTCLVERPLDADAPGETLPMPFVVRAANRLTLAHIQHELRGAKAAELSAGEVQVGSRRPAWLTRLFTASPAFLRDLVLWRPLLRNPFRAKATMGTVAVTAVGMMAPGVLDWGIPVGVHPLMVVVGGIAQRRRPLRSGQEDGNDELVALTILFDHAVVDGAPVARFIQRLQSLMAAGFALDELDEGAAAANDGALTEEVTTT